MRDWVLSGARYGNRALWTGSVWSRTGGTGGIWSLTGGTRGIWSLAGGTGGVWALARGSRGVWATSSISATGHRRNGWVASIGRGLDWVVTSLRILTTLRVSPISTVSRISPLRIVGRGRGWRRGWTRRSISR